MSFSVFGLVLLSAILHAAWNALVRAERDQVLAVIRMGVGMSVFSLTLIPIVPLPAAPAWPWIVAGALLHSGYKIFLGQAYRYGDITQVYPLARGSAPLIVAAIGLLFLGDRLHLGEAGAILAIAAGVILMGLRGGAGLVRLPARILGFALLTACFTAGYSLVDGIGARLALNATSFIAWMVTIDSLFMLAYLKLSRPRLPFVRALTENWPRALLISALAFAGYWIVIWAFTVAPIALVASLRETSVLFVFLFGAVFLREAASHWRLAASLLILVGVVSMRLV